MSFDEAFQHRGDLVLEREVVLRDDPGGQALEAGELERVDLAIRNHLEEVDGSLGRGVPGVDVSSVLQEKLDNLEFKNRWISKVPKRLCFFSKVPRSGGEPGISLIIVYFLSQMQRLRPLGYCAPRGYVVMDRALACGATSSRLDSCNIKMFFSSCIWGGRKKNEPVMMKWHDVLSPSGKNQNQVLALLSMRRHRVSARL